MKELLSSVINKCRLDALAFLAIFPLLSTAYASNNIDLSTFDNFLLDPSFEILFQPGHKKDLFGYKRIMGNFPAKGSVEEAQDFATLFHYQNTRTAADCQAAGAQSSVSLKNFYAGPNGVLSDKEVKKLNFLLLGTTIKSGFHSTISKWYFKRPRPYKSNPDIKPCIKLSNTYAYPSGHTLMAWMYGHVLAHKFPERAARIYQLAEQGGMNRIIGGVHHPSDVVAGKKLAAKLASLFLADPEFIKSLDSI